MVNAPSALAALVLLLGAAICGSVGMAILRRAKRDAEATVMIAMTACLTLQLALFAVSDWLYLTLHAIGPRTEFVLIATAQCLVSLILALGTHFLGLTYLRITGDDPDFDPPFGVPQPLRIMVGAVSSRWRALPVWATTRRGFNFLMLSGMLYLYAAIRIGVWILGTVKTLGDAAVWRPGIVPAFPYSGMDDFMIGAFAGGWLTIQTLAVGAIYFMRGCRR